MASGPNQPAAVRVDTSPGFEIPGFALVPSITPNFVTLFPPSVQPTAFISVT